MELRNRRKIKCEHRSASYKNKFQVVKYLNENNKITVLEENLSEIQVTLEAQLPTFISLLG